MGGAGAMAGGFVGGLRLFGRAWAMAFRSPRLLLIGAIPAVITTVLLLAGVVALLLNIDELAAWITPFADGWASMPRQATRVIASIAVLGAAGFGLVVTFTAVTLLVGGPFYEHVAERIDDQLGGAPPQRTSWIRSTLRGLRDSVLLLGASLLCAVPLLLAGFVPVLGQTVVPVLGVCVGAWLLALEVVGVTFLRRGLKLADRRAALRRHRGLTLGTAVPAYLLCAVPFAAIVVMPVAVVAGTLLAREVLPPALPPEPTPGPYSSSCRTGPGSPSSVRSTPPGSAPSAAPRFSPPSSGPGISATAGSR